MRRCSDSIVLVVAIATAAAAAITAGEAAAAPGTQWFTADVKRVESRWTADGSRIVTDATVRTLDGTERVVSQLGGTAGGYTMVQWHGPAQLEPGLRVRIAAHPTSAAATATWIADDVIVEDSVGAATPSVRTVTKKSGRPLYWAKSCVEVRRAEAGTSAITDEASIVSASLATWNDGISTCAYLDLVEGGAEVREAAVDRVNVIIFRDTRWCRPPLGDDPERCFSGAAAGVTTVTFVDDPDDGRDGEIVDADIELNNVTFRITHEGQGTGTAVCDSDLANTLVHELGHLLGLEHTCRTLGDPPRIDHTGAAVPLCDDVPNDLVINDATMFPYQDCGETKKASLEADDIDAICRVYPTADDPGVCEPPDDLTGGCCDAGGSPSAPLALAVLSLLLVGLRPRRSPTSAR